MVYIEKPHLRLTSGSDSESLDSSFVLPRPINRDCWGYGGLLGTVWAYCGLFRLVRDRDWPYCGAQTVLEMHIGSPTTQDSMPQRSLG